MTTTVRQVKFPCGRLGLEMETLFYGGSEIVPSYDYAYAGRDYHEVAKNEGRKLEHDYYGRIEGIKEITRKEINLNLFQLVLQMSVDFVGYPTPDQVPKPPLG